MNDLQRYLDTLGLPWRDSRGELRSRFGLQRCKWSLDDVVELAVTPEPFPRLIRPLQFRDEPFRAQHVPPIELSGYADPERDAMANLRAVAAVVAAALGPGEYDDASTNARGYEWRIGPALLRLLCFPPRLQGNWADGNEWHRREPRLREACHIYLSTGYRPPLTRAERDWVDGFVPAVALGDGGVPASSLPAVRRQPTWLARAFGAAGPMPPRPPPEWANPAQACVGNNLVVETALEYVREPPPSVEQVFGRLGASPGGEALIWCTDQLRIVPRAHVAGLRLDRCGPERGIGDGDATLVLCCRADPAGPMVEVDLARRYGMDSLDDLACEIADWLELSLEHADFF